MQESPQQYTQRILGYVGGENPLKVQQGTAAKLTRLIRGVPPKRLRQRPAPEKWSVGEILAHLAEVELVAGFRIRMMLGANGTPIQAFDQDVWAREGNYARRDPRASLELFRALRAANLALLSSLRPEQWENYGIHAERGKETVAHTARLFAGHDINHLRQIEGILSNSARKGKAARRK